MARSKIRAQNPAFPSRRSQRLDKSASSTETDDTSNPSKRARPSPTDGVDASASVSNSVIDVPGSSSEAARMNDSQRGPVSSLEEGPIPKTGSERGGDECQPIEEGDEDEEDNEDHREEGEDHFDDAKGQVAGDRVVFRKRNKVTGKQLSFFNYVNVHLKSRNVPKNQVHDFKLSLSQKWKELLPEEKANYVHPDKEGYSSASYSEGSAPAVYKVDTRTSSHRFKSLIGEFNEEKLAACRELGFRPLLKLAITRMHLSIMRLIVDATSVSDKSITMHGTKLPLSANDVDNVMGLKNDGSPVVFEGHVKDYTELEATANEMAGPDHKIQLAKVEAYLKETQLVDDKFKRLFILFTMSTIISPTASLSIPKKWLLCARNPADYALKNWAEYVFDSLMAGIFEFQQRENGAKTSGKFCSCCLLFLELFHFDCVGHEKHFVDRSLYPIEAWGDEEVGRVLKYINQLGGMLDSRVGWKKVGGQVRTDDVAPGVSRQEFDLAMGRVGRLEDQVRNIGAEMGQGFAAIISRLDSMGAAGPLKAKGIVKKKECNVLEQWNPLNNVEIHKATLLLVPVDLDRSPPKKKVTVILSDSTSIVSPEKKDIPKPNPFEGKNRRINIGSFRVYGDGDVIDKGVVTNVCDPCSAKELVEKIVLSTTGDI
ncbi:hypothetical protein ACLB2K_034038 [Fragaria x ananassa]